MIEDLKVFIAVVEYNNFTKAGEAINMSQPSVSQHIKNLEKEFDAKLIERSYKSKKILITPLGKILYSRAKQIIYLLDETRGELLDYKNNVSGLIRIGASFTIGEFVLPKVLGEFSKIYPEVEFNITINNTREICSMVKDLSLDIGLVEGIFDKNEFLYGAFSKDNMLLAAPKSINLSNKFKKEEFEKFTWIARESGSGTREYLEFFLADNEITPKKMIIFGSNYSVKEAVRHNLGATVISEHVLKEAIKLNELNIIRLPKKYERKFSYIVPRGNIHSKIVDVLINELKNQ